MVGNETRKIPLAGTGKQKDAFNEAPTRSRAGRAESVMRAAILIASCAALLFASPARAMSDAEAKAACTALARLADQGVLGRLAIAGRNAAPADLQAAGPGWNVTDEEQATLRAGSHFSSGSLHTVYRLSLSSAGKPARFGSFFAGGTCHATQTRNVEVLLQSKGSDDGVDAVPDPDDKLRWVYWGGGDYPVLHRGRHFMVTADLGDPNRLRMVSWIKPDGRQRPLCLLAAENVAPGVVSAREPALCRAVASGSLAPLEWKPMPQPMPHGYSEEFQRRYGRIADAVEVLSIDIDGDGRSENVGRFGYASSAGCGSTQAWLSVLSKDLGTALPGALDHPGGEALEVYGSGGRYYISNLAERTGGSLVAIRDGRSEQVCKFQPRTKTAITDFFGAGR